MKVFTVPVLCCVAVASQAASFTVHLTSTVTVQTAAYSDFGFAVFPGSPSHGSGSTGDAFATATAMSSAVSAGGTHTLDAAGGADPDLIDHSSAFGTASVNQKFNLGDFSPTNGIWVKLAYSYSWTIDLATDDDQTATADLDISLAGQVLDHQSFSIGDNDFVSESGHDSDTVDVFLPANAVTSKFFNASISGTATAEPEPVPEPSMIVPLGAGLTAFTLRRRRK